MKINKQRYLFCQTFYKRKLPKHLIPFNSITGKKLFQESLMCGTLESFFPLSEQFITQKYPGSCGTSSLIMILNALNVDPKIQWKGVWRWYDEDNLVGSTQEYSQSGLSLEQFGHLIIKNNLSAQTFFCNLNHQPQISSQICPQNSNRQSQIYIKNASFSTFKDCLLATSRRKGLFMILNNSRQIMGLTGDGHYSPVSGFHQNKDKVLYLDVARFKYPSFWLDSLLLYQSMQKLSQSGESRLYLYNMYIYKNRVNDHISNSGCIVLNLRHLLHYYLLVL